MEREYYYFTFTDYYDDGFGGSTSFTNSIALASDSIFFEMYKNNHLSMEKISKEEYEELGG